MNKFADQIFAAKTEPGVVDIVRLPEVVCIRAAGNYIDFQLVNGHSMHRATLSNVLKQLPSSFVQVHRSYVINIAHLRRLQSELGRYSECVLTGNKIIPLGKQYRKALLQLLSIESPPSSS
ncbi:LytR/AlgR family response regulator transcription factor [Aliidiomarina halalkaliphila]|uniref:LytR/AlgR family response regulator transcription factor n=1 Tax=Aliidiomarina halalkaliphila TaxID=2593535 RepID=UPI00163DD7FF|nr:LytTR family DNA-binding domain-containing protein [Aliidiomarina halalkaliphila]